MKISRALHLIAYEVNSRVVSLSQKSILKVHTPFALDNFMRLAVGLVIYVTYTTPPLVKYKTRDTLCRVSL